MFKEKSTGIHNKPKKKFFEECNKNLGGIPTNTFGEIVPRTFGEILQNFCKNLYNYVLPYLYKIKVSLRNSLKKTVWLLCGILGRILDPWWNS